MVTNTIFIILAISLVVLGFYRWGRKTLPLPPGPKKYPFIGNLLNAPTTLQWVQYAQWSKDLSSDIIHLQVFGSTIIILNSLEAANNLLTQRSTRYSSRPINTMISELMGQDYAFVFSPYGDDWRAHRRLFWQEFNPSNSSNHRPTQIKYARDLLRRLLEQPGKFLDHIHYTFGATIMSVSYGLDVQQEDDPNIALAEKAMHHVANAAISGSFLVDHLPFLKYMPRWMPGAGFLKFADKALYDTNRMIEVPYAEARERLAAGKAKPSIISRSLAGNIAFVEGGEDERVLKNVAAVSYGAGSDTSPPALGSFIAAMLLYPDVQAKAQEELNAYIGSRLPDFEDRPYLPYTQAIMWEVLRWQPVVPLGVAHCLTADDEYKGYYLPKNSIVIGNIWAILRDENRYPDPEIFNPERFLKDGKIDPHLTEAVAAFGFGRRICPGRFMAMDTLWISIVSILAAFNIAKAKDENGRDIEPHLEYTSGVARKLLPFECSIKPRSKDAERMVNDAVLSGDY